MAKDDRHTLAFGDVKCGGRIIASTDIGDTLALIKVDPISNALVNNQTKHKLFHGTPFPQFYNTLSTGENGATEYFFLPDDVVVVFFADF